MVFLITACTIKKSVNVMLVEMETLYLLDGATRHIYYQNECIGLRGCFFFFRPTTYDIANIPRNLCLRTMRMKNC